MGNLKAFELGKKINLLKMRVQEKQEVLIHQSCDDILKALDGVEGDTSKTEEKLKRMNYVIEWTEAEVDRFIFWATISQWVDEAEDDLKEVLE